MNTKLKPVRKIEKDGAKAFLLVLSLIILNVSFIAFVVANNLNPAWAFLGIMITFFGTAVAIEVTQSILKALSPVDEPHDYVNKVEDKDEF